jgi:hypothetical protein
VRHLFTLRVATSLVLATSCAPSDGSLHASRTDSADMVFGRDDLATWRLENGFRVSPPIATPARSQLATLVFGERADQIEVAIGEPIPIVHATAEFAVGRAAIGSGEVELRVRDRDVARIASLRIAFDAIRAEEPRPEIAGRTEPLLAELAALGVVPRESWGSRSTTCDPDPDKHRFAIHHSVTNGDDDPVTVARGIQSFHMDGRGYCDAGYHFGVGLDGTIYELRSLDRLGAHTGMQNTGNIGIVFFGCFDATECDGFGPTVPSEVSVEAVRRLVATLAGIYAIDVSEDTLKGHRQWPGQDTVCPGSVLLDRLAVIRAAPEPGDPLAALDFERRFRAAEPDAGRADAGTDGGVAPEPDDGCSVAQAPATACFSLFALALVARRWRRGA